MTVINKVNDDSESYFREIKRFCFVIQCSKIAPFSLLILKVFFILLIIRAVFLILACFVKVSSNLQLETCLWINVTSSKFSYHIPVGLFCIFKDNENADWLRGLTSKQ